MWTLKLVPQPTQPDGFCHADIDALSGGGLQYELLDGTLLVTPPQGAAHHAATAACLRLLAASCPVQLWALSGPVDYRPNHLLSLRADVVACRREDFLGTTIEQPLLLAVEVLTSTTRVMDVQVKRELYEQTGVASYWIFDPIDQMLTVLELVDGVYVERAVVKGDDVFEAELPFAVRVVPSELVSR